MIHISRDTALRAATAVNLNAEAVLRDPYTGHYMYGDMCWGIFVPSTAKATEFLVALTAVHAMDATELHLESVWTATGVIRLMAAKTLVDTVKPGFVAYWPGYRLTA
ncbi:hypothetical protein ACPZ19_04700 [Amycolatopsis lurida]